MEVATRGQLTPVEAGPCYTKRNSLARAERHELIVMSQDICGDGGGRPPEGRAQAHPRLLGQGTDLGWKWVSGCRVSKAVRDPGLEAGVWLSW